MIRWHDMISNTHHQMDRVAGDHLYVRPNPEVLNPQNHTERSNHQVFKKRTFLNKTGNHHVSPSPWPRMCVKSLEPLIGPPSAINK